MAAIVLASIGWGWRRRPSRRRRRLVEGVTERKRQLSTRWQLTEVFGVNSCNFSYF